MFAASGVLTDARQLNPIGSLDELLADARRFFGRLEHHPTGRQGPTLRITRAPEVLASVTDAVERWRQEHGEEDALVLAQALIQPVRLFEAETAVDGDLGFIL